MTLSEEIVWRGFLNQTTYQDLTALDKGKIVFYNGFDVSSDSQTIGNLAAMMLDRCFLRHGHKALIIAGGATSLIGDPGGKDSERQLQSVETIAHNTACAEEQIKRIFTGFDFTLLNNLTWTHKMNVIDYLRNYGKYFSMTPLIQRDYIAKRIGEDGAGISYAEFSYTILQGIDYLHLYDEYNCTLQIGGADQWGNCLSGVDLIRRQRGAEVNVLSLPLIINKATGKKFGKTEDGAVWLDSKKTTPTEFYQFWINSDDLGSESYLKIYTELSKEEIDEAVSKHRQNPGARHAQLLLAREVTTLVHGKDKMLVAEAVTEFLTGKKPIGDAGDILDHIRKEIPTVATNSDGSIIEVLVTSGLASSNTEAHRLITDNAVSINGVKVNRDVFEAGDFQNQRLLLRRGKSFKDATLVELKS
jgi:tyrosyl-tRNA synthetase